MANPIKNAEVKAYCYAVGSGAFHSFQIKHHPVLFFNLPIHLQTRAYTFTLLILFKRQSLHFFNIFREDLLLCLHFQDSQEAPPELRAVHPALYPKIQTPRYTALKNIA